jgi:hypothetical protein
MTYEQDHMTRQRNLEIGIDHPNLVPGHIIGTHCPDPSVSKPPGGTAAYPSRLQIHYRILPERTITSTQKYNISLTYRDSLLLSRSF